jgi:hypothetical protein
VGESPTAQRASSSAPPSTVAHSLARAYAIRLFAEDGPPHPSAHQIDAAARTIPTSCSTPRYDQYPCVVHPPNETPPVQACAALANAAGHVGEDEVRCGDRAAPAPIVRPGYVDCARIGHAVTIRGHAGTFSQVGGDHRDDSRAHLLIVRVASNSHQLCWDFQTAAPPAAGERIDLGVGGSMSGLDFDSPDGPSAQDGPSAISAQAGSSGNWTSLLVNADDLDPPVHGFPSRYSFVADAEWNNTKLGRGHAYGEDLIHGQYP